MIKWLEKRWVDDNAQVSQYPSSTLKAFYASRGWVNGTIRYLAIPPKGFSLAYRCDARPVDILAREPYRTILAWIHWWTIHRWALERYLVRLGLYRSPVEGDYYKNFKLDPPGLWGTPPRKHEVWLEW